MSLFRRVLLPLLFIFTLLDGCQQQPSTQASPLLKSAPSQLMFIDDGDRNSLLSCARIHRDYLAHLPAKYQTIIEGRRYPVSWLLLSMDEFISILEKAPDQQELNRQINEKFTAFQAGGRQSKPGKGMLVTGYYIPLFKGSLVRKEPYLYPLYAMPKTLILRKNQKTGKQSIGRQNSKGNFVTFWTRAEIENTKELAGEELVYLKDPIDAFLLHVQGSGEILLKDGSQRSVRFAGHNGHTYKSIGKVLVDEGKLTLAETSIPTIRGYLQKHPEEQQRILQSNPRFIFFKWGDDKPPHGSLGRPLTPGRSIAIDRKVLPDSLFGWLQTSVPVVDHSGNIQKWKTTHRFVLPQDSGAAIQGTGRVDLFWGSGAYAEIAANNMKENGKLYFFIKKGYAGGR